MAERRQFDGRRSTDKVCCPECNHGVSRVLDSRGPKRLRACDACGARYVTGEIVERRVPRDCWSLGKTSGDQTNSNI